MSENNDQHHARTVREAAGMLASGLADEIARPLREVRELLASAVATLDEHVATAKGPDPLTYDQSKAVREIIASAYLKSADVERVASDLAAAVVVHGAVESCDLNRLIDDAVSLVRHRFATSTELFIDYGTVPAVHTVSSELVLALVRILLHCADSTRNAGDGAISIRTALVEKSGIDKSGIDKSGIDKSGIDKSGIDETGRREVRLTIAENGRGGDDDEMARVTGLLRRVAESLGGSLAVAAKPGAGATFELRFPDGQR